jgi:hypothetical protein
MSFAKGFSASSSPLATLPFSFSSFYRGSFGSLAISNNEKSGCLKLLIGALISSRASL